MACLGTPQPGGCVIAGRASTGGTMRSCDDCASLLSRSHRALVLRRGGRAHLIERARRKCAHSSARDERKEVSVEALHVGEHEAVRSTLINGQSTPWDQLGSLPARQA